MSAAPDISAVIGTYNRCELLGDAIERILSQQADGLCFELIVVDNNSTDQTRQVVESFIARGHSQVRYLFEGQQGVSHARNAGIAVARAPIIAFTDDDVRVAPDWLATIKHTFDQHPEVDMVGGKVLPQWSSPPPSWLTRDHWAPLGILDFGDQPFYLNAQRPCCMLTANLAVRKHVFAQIGTFRPEFQRVKNSIGSTEDHELLLRFYKRGSKGLYAPNIEAVAAVQEERLTKAYHRRWHTGHGRFSALMGLEPAPHDAPRLFGAPAYMYRQLFRFACQWARASLKALQADALRYENELRYMSNYIRTLAEQSSARREKRAPAEIAAFANLLIRRKVSALRRNTLG